MGGLVEGPFSVMQTERRGRNQFFIPPAIDRRGKDMGLLGQALRGLKIPAATGEPKPTNPKDAIGSDKIPLHLWPETATVLGSMAMLFGALQYGRANFRAIGVRSSIYYDAARRHLNKWFEGEDLDPDSGLPHLAHALATIAIIVDAQAAGKLNDDRQTRGGYVGLINQMTPHVKRLKELFKGKNPKHYTIQDNKE